MAHIRFRAAMKAQNQSLDDLPFTAILGVYGSYFGLGLNVLCIMAQGFIAIFPVGNPPSAYNFFVNMLALPIVLVCYVGWKIVFRTRFVSAREADLITGRRELDLGEAKRLDLEERAKWKWYHKYLSLRLGLTVGYITFFVDLHLKI